MVLFCSKDVTQESSLASTRHVRSVWYIHNMRLVLYTMQSRMPIRTCSYYYSIVATAYSMAKCVCKVAYGLLCLKLGSGALVEHQPGYFLLQALH